MAFHLLDSTPQKNHVGIVLGSERSHDLKLDLRAHDLAFETRSCFDGTACLLLENVRPVSLLKAAERVFSLFQIALGAGNLFGKKHALPAHLGGAKLSQSSIEFFYIEI